MVELLIVLILILGLFNLCANIIILRIMVDDCNDALNIESGGKGGLFNMKWGIRRNASKEEIAKDICEDVEVSEKSKVDDALYLAYLRNQINLLETDKNFGRISEDEYFNKLDELALDISDMERKYGVA